MTAVTICNDFGAQKNKFSHCFPSICHEVMGSYSIILIFWMLSIQPTFSLSSFTLIKSLFSSSSVSAIRVVISAYLRLLIFLPVILIPACASSSPTFLMMYSAYKLNKQGDNIQPWRTPFPIWNQSVVPCPVLTVASWPALQISQEAGQVVWYSHLFKNFPHFVVIHTVKGFDIVNKAEIDVFLELSCFFDDPTDVGNLISGSSAFSKTSLNFWKFIVHVLLKPGLENFEHYFPRVWDECNCALTIFRAQDFISPIQGVSPFIGGQGWKVWPSGMYAGRIH